MSKHDYHDPHHGMRETYHDLEVERRHEEWIRDRIAEVLRKYNITLPDAPMSALVLAMQRVGAKPRSLLRPPTVATAPDITTPEGAKKSREAADYHRKVLKPFA